MAQKAMEKAALLIPLGKGFRDGLGHLPKGFQVTVSVFQKLVELFFLAAHPKNGSTLESIDHGLRLFRPAFPFLRWEEAGDPSLDTEKALSRKEFQIHAAGLCQFPGLIEF
jgi:hypothetical protein